MKKKVVAVLLIGALSLSLMACGSDALDENQNVEEDIEDEQVEDEQAEDDIEVDLEEDVDVVPEEVSTDIYTYNVDVFSDSYVDITLVSISNDTLTLEVHNNTGSAINFDCTYIFLDDVEYTYDYTEYGSDFIEIEADDSSSYVFVEPGYESSFPITNPECGTFAGVFGIWDADGALLEYANVTAVQVGESSTSSIDEGTLLYSDSYVDIALLEVSNDTLAFRVANNTEDVINFDCSYIKLDEEEYTYDGSEYGSPFITIGSSGSRTYLFTSPLFDEVIITIDNPDFSIISGEFGVWAADGDWLEYADVPETEIY